MEEQKKLIEKPNDDITIVCGNLGVLVLYTLISRYAAGGIGDAFFILIHFVTCMITAIATRRWTWVLSGILVLIIGVSTCVNFMKF